MTAEGVFPKINGDILYASEANRFSPKFIGFVSQYPAFNVSGTSAYTTIGGTVTYNGKSGSVAISEFIVCIVDVFSYISTELTTVRLRISGTAGLNFATDTHGYNTGTVRNIPFRHVFTSGALTASGGNVGSDYVISVEANNAYAGNSVTCGDLLVYGW